MLIRLEGESDPKARPKGVVAGSRLIFLHPIVIAMGCRRRLNDPELFPVHGLREVSR